MEHTMERLDDIARKLAKTFGLKESLSDRKYWEWHSSNGYRLYLTTERTGSAIGYSDTSLKLIIEDRTCLKKQWVDMEVDAFFKDTYAYHFGGTRTKPGIELANHLLKRKTTHGTSKKRVYVPDLSQIYDLFWLTLLDPLGGRIPDTIPPRAERRVKFHRAYRTGGALMRLPDDIQVAARELQGKQMHLTTALDKLRLASHPFGGNITADEKGRVVRYKQNSGSLVHSFCLLHYKSA